MEQKHHLLSSLPAARVDDTDIRWHSGGAARVGKKGNEKERKGEKKKNKQIKKRKKLPTGQSQTVHKPLHRLGVDREQERET